MTYEMTDEEFLGYCDLHCETPVGMFHRKHIARLAELAGDVATPLAQEWYRPSERAVKEAVARARGRRS
jgi:hypothetical protein